MWIEGSSIDFDIDLADAEQIFLLTRVGLEVSLSCLQLYIWPLPGRWTSVKQQELRSTILSSDSSSFSSPGSLIPTGDDCEKAKA